MANSVLDAVKEIGPTIAARSDEIESARGQPLDVVELIKPTGAFRMYVVDIPPLAWESIETLFPTDG